MDWTYWQNIANDQQTQRNNNLRDQETDAENQANVRQNYITDETVNINKQFPKAQCRTSTRLAFSRG